MSPPNTPVHRQATRRVALQFDAHGNPEFATVCSPTSFPVRALGVVPKRHVIPVVFVPGIMGSNLRSVATPTQKSEPAWSPPDGVFEGLGEWGSRFKQKAKERQRQLTPGHCEVNSEGEVSLSSNTYTLTEAEAKRRGWGEVAWGGYGPVLMALERALNDQREDAGTPDAEVMAVWKLAQQAETIKQWNPVKGQPAPLTIDEFSKLGDYYFPVWACGYNWLESNEKSAERLNTRIADALAWYSQPECHYFIPEGRVIVVTHSMGGLVGRRAAQLKPDNILGVVHGVQPVGGAPVVYRRFRAGTEAGGFWDLKGNMIAEVLGWDSAAITCVMANAPGPMELLPTKHHPPGWLRFERQVGDQFEQVMPPLPQSDPYEEIYAKHVQGVWWGMVDEDWIDPAKLAEVEQKNTSLEWHKLQLKAARNFHEQLKLYFHPQTYAHYGSDQAQPSFGAVRWVTSDTLPADMKADLSNWPSSSWTGLGKATLESGENRVHWHLANKLKPSGDGDDNAGDATVPRQSGALVEQGGDSMQAAFRMKGFEHADSYKSPEVQNNVTYCIGKLVQLAKPIKDLPQSKGSSCNQPTPSGDSSPASPADLPSTSPAAPQPTSSLAPELQP